MADENKLGPTSRRALVTSAAKVAVTAPAVGLLLSASTVPAGAIGFGSAKAHHILDDYTFGNSHEDIDAHRYGNFNPRNGQANQDDIVIDDITDDVHPHP